LPDPGDMSTSRVVVAVEVPEFACIQMYSIKSKNLHKKTADAKIKVDADDRVSHTPV